MDVDIKIVKEYEAAQKQIINLEGEICAYMNQLRDMRLLMSEILEKNRNLECENARLQGLVDGLTVRCKADDVK